MRKHLLIGLAFGALTVGYNARADYNPVTLLTNTFNADVIIETNAPKNIACGRTQSPD